MDSLLDYDQELLAPPWGSLGRDAVLGAVATVTKLLLNVLNTTRAINHETYLDLVMHRPPGVGLLTVSNHTSTYDDPGLPCALLPLSFFWTEHTHQKNRWTMCAKDICFTNEFLRQFFLNGKVLPVERGAGVNQSSVSVAARALGNGDWLHIFPEGRVVPSGQVGPFRQGIGKLICEARAVQGSDPIILPFFHSGMGKVMPFKSIRPRLGNEIVVAVGQPLDLSHITCRCNQPGEDQPEVWRDLAVALRHAVTELQDQVPPNPNQLNRPEVAAYEAKYQERVRKAREQQRLSGQSEPASLMVRHDQPQQQQQQGEGSEGIGRREQQRQPWRSTRGSDEEVEQELTAEQEWQLQQRQLLAVVRRVYRQQQAELEHIVDISMHQGTLQQQQQHGGQQDGKAKQQDTSHRRWQDVLQRRGQQLLHTWQQLQDRQVAMLLARSKAISSDSNSAGSSSSSSSAGSAAAAKVQRSSSWSWLAWAPFISKAAVEHQS